MGKGRNEGRLGSFRCVWNSTLTKKPVKFNVSGMKDNVRKSYEKDHPIGSSITFQYMGFVGKSGIPRFPQYKGLRRWRQLRMTDIPDSAWGDVYAFIYREFNVLPPSPGEDLCGYLSKVRVYE